MKDTHSAGAERTPADDAQIAFGAAASHDAAALFAGPGEMRARCRDFDWSATPLGSVARWPQSLRTMASVALASAFAKILLWGPDLIQIYNEAYIPFLGAKHPWGLGRPTRECWPEAWDFNAPIYERVWAGETIYLEDQLYTLARRGPDQPLDDVYIPSRTARCVTRRARSRGCSLPSSRRPRAFTHNGSRRSASAY